MKNQTILGTEELRLKKKDFQKIKDENYIKKFDERKFFSNDIEQWYGSAFNLTPSKKNEYKNVIDMLQPFIEDNKVLLTDIPGSKQLDDGYFQYGIFEYTEFTSFAKGCFPIHHEYLLSDSINYCIEGGSKRWYVFHHSERNKLEKYLNTKYKESMKGTCKTWKDAESNPLSHRTLFPINDTSMFSNFQYYDEIKNQGDIFIIRGGASHMGYSLAFNYSIAIAYWHMTTILKFKSTNEISTKCKCQDELPNEEKPLLERISSIILKRMTTRQRNLHVLVGDRYPYAKINNKKRPISYDQINKTKQEISNTEKNSRAKVKAVWEKIVNQYNDQKKTKNLITIHSHKGEFYYNGSSFKIDIKKIKGFEELKWEILLKRFFDDLVEGRIQSFEGNAKSRLLKLKPDKKKRFLVIIDEKK
jgi:hypothetical protein